MPPFPLLLVTLHFSHMATSKSTFSYFWSYYNCWLIKCRHNWFLKKLKKYIKETTFLPSWGSIFCVCGDDLSLINTMQKTLKLSIKIVSIPKMNERKNFIPRNFSRRVASPASMRCKLLQKKKALLEKHQSVPNTLRHIAIEKDILSLLSKCIF